MEEYKGITGEHSSSMSIIFFIFGLIGAIGFRIILLLNKINPSFAIVAWYAAVIAYLFFYSYRLYIENKRRQIIIVNRLREKVHRGELSIEDRDKINTLLDSILMSKMYWNLLVLLITTAIALLIQILVDIFLGV